MAKIDRFDVYLCVADVSEPRGPSSGWYRTRESVLVRLGDADGQAGWGEAGLRPGVVEAARELGVTLLGANPRHAGSLLDQLTRTTADQWAVSAISVAIDDLRARQVGLSIADLYGGRRRDAVRAYASMAGTTPPGSPRSFGRPRPPRRSPRASARSSSGSGATLPVVSCPYSPRSGQPTALAWR